MPSSSITVTQAPGPPISWSDPTGTAVVRPDGTSALLFDKLLEQNGAVLNGTTDDSGAIQAAIDKFTATSRGRIIFPSGVSAKINTGLTLKAGLVAIDFSGSPIIWGGSSGYALTILPNDVSPFSIWARVNPISNLILMGSSSESNNSDGILIGSLGGSGDVTGLSLQNVTVTGFRDCMYFGDEFFISQFWNLILEDGWRYGLNYVAQNVAGENVSWHGGRVSDCNHSSGSGVGIYMANSDSGSNELNLFGVSLDYNDKQFSVNAGILDMHGCHIEDNHYANVLGEIVWNSGDTPAGVSIRGGEVGITESNANARPTLFNVGGQKAFLFAETLFNLFDKSTAIVAVTSSSPQIDLGKSKLDFAGSTSFPTVGTYLNGLYNGDIEAGNTNGWNTSGTNHTWTADGSVKRSGSFSLKDVSTGGVNGNAHQFVTCRPGQQVIFRAWVSITSLSAGQVFLETRFYSANPDSTTTFQIASDDTGSWSGTTAGFVEVKRTAIAPAGSKWAYLGLHANSFTGTLYLDDAEVYVL